MEWEHQKNNEYREWMIDWMGKEAYEALERRARSFRNRAEAVADWKAFFEAL